MLVDRRSIHFGFSFELYSFSGGKIPAWKRLKTTMMYPLAVLLVAICSQFGDCQNWYGHNYWNNRYKDDGISYSDSTFYMWSSHTNAKDRYFYKPSYYNIRKCTGGCSCGAELKGCGGSVVDIRYYSIQKLSSKSFRSSVREINLINMPSLKTVEDEPFEQLTSLRKLHVYNTGITVVPDISKTQMKELYIVNSKIRFFSHNYTRQTLPSTLKRVSLIGNEIDWLPTDLFRGTDIEILALSRNKIWQFPGSGFAKMPNLWFLGLNENVLEVVSKEHLSHLAGSSLVHLNLSNNNINYIQPGALAQLETLKILELHDNSFSEIPEGTFNNIKSLIHLDLVKNKLEVMTANSITNLPKILTIRIHTQRPKMTSVQYNAFYNIHETLKHLWISDNALKNFPHPTLSEQTYEALKEIYAQDNLITDPTVYSPDDFPKSMRNAAKLRAASNVPFKSLPKMDLLNLGHNAINFIRSDYFCNAINLQFLYLDNNGLKNDRIPKNAFDCSPKLQWLYMYANFLTYVPEAAVSSVLKNLNFLHLSINNITFIEAGTFTPLVGLRDLRLSYNNIIIIENGSFPDSLESFWLTDNKFRFTHENPFTNLKKLRNLRLAYNEIEDIPDTAFHGCTSLDLLDMYNNKIGQIQQELLKDAPLRIRLLLNNNRITYIEDGALKHLTSMNEIFLHENRLTKVPVGGDFHNLNVQQLRLQKNRITELQPGTFKSLTVTKIFDLTFNQISVINTDAFVDVDGEPKQFGIGANPVWQIESGAFKNMKVEDILFQYIKINHLKKGTFENVEARDIIFTTNKIDYLEEGVFAGTTKIRNLLMPDVGIKAIYGGLFSGSSTVTSIDFGNNQLETLPPDLLSNVNIVELKLKNNKLANYPKDMFQNSNLVKIDVSYNKIESLPPDAFVGQERLIEVILQGNQISEIENGTLDPLVNVQVFDASKNKLVYLERGIFNTMTSLKTLKLADNLLYFFPGLNNGSVAQTIDLSNNLLYSIETFAFSPLNGTLKKLDLTGNSLQCSCQLYKTLEEVKKFIKGGNCSSPPKVQGLDLGKEKENGSTYFASKSRDKSVYVCAPTHLVADSKGKSINLTWSLSAYLDVSEWDDDNKLDNKTQVIYNATCVSATGKVLRGTSNTTSFLFDQTYNVEASTEYVCVVAMSVGDAIGANSQPLRMTTAEGVVDATNDTNAQDGLVLPFLLWDFNAIHPDFAGLATDIISNPKYIQSPYGAWLAKSANPRSDTFSDWFVKRDGINHQKNTTLVLASVSTDPPTFRFSSSAFFPLDDFGYGNEQKDCSGYLHNFGFTSAIRTGIVYQGNESITIGGGDDIWLYINRKLVLYLATRSTAVKCKRIDLSQAKQPGGARIIPQEGTVSSGACVINKQLTSEAVTLELEENERYHFVLFHTERIPCKSNFFMEVTNFKFILDDKDEPPKDYIVTIDEDFHIGGILEEITLTDSFAAGPPFKVRIYSGNEGRHFTVKSDTQANQDAGVAPAPTTYINTTVENVTFVECSSLSSVTPDSVDKTVEEFTISSQFALFTLKTQVDYELTKQYSVSLEVIDYNKTPENTGTVGIKIKIQDVNDNCPELAQRTFTIFANPSLQTEPVVRLNASDIDSGNNSRLVFYRTSIVANPPVKYNESEDLHRSVYTKNTSLEYTVVVMDYGNPVRGTTANITMIVDNSCLVSVDHEPIPFDFTLDTEKGFLHFVVPGYYNYAFECLRVAGIQKAYIRDEFITASSAKFASGPERARLNMTTLPADLDGLTGGWVADIDDTNQWIQVDMQDSYVFRVIQLQGRDDADNYVTSFSIFVRENVTSFVKYTNASGNDVFEGTSDQNTVVDIVLDPPARGQYIRINPQTWVGHVSLRLELKGCTQKEEFHFQVSCERCKSSWYCPGDGRLLPCGRCDPPVDNSTCGRSRTEHSFGIASECSPCPLGWLCKNGLASPCPDFHYIQCNDTNCPDKCIPCEAGYSCRGGQHYYCIEGTVSDGKKKFCELCTPGTYQDESGKTKCKSCPAGTRSTTMKDKCEPCNSRSWSKGDGTDCMVCKSSTECPCLASTTLCFKGVACRNIQTSGGGHSHKCDSCPPGYKGDGVSCTDVNECTEYEPCWNSSACRNTEPGYQCLRCPDGLEGSFEDALAINVTQRAFLNCNKEHAASPSQVCQDVDECATNNGGCDPNAFCHNTLGSFTCGICKPGYVGSSKYGCQLADFCISGKHTCSPDGACFYTGPADYMCQCNNGLAGNGFTCGVDVDLDGYPSEGISCKGEEFGPCGRDNCPTIPNSGQEDNDKDWMGDSCDDDDDNDTVFDEDDNCPMVFNNKQEDKDNDKIGDHCDNCPNNPNKDQVDSDKDGEGDVCDTDDDNDGRNDAADNCPLVKNAGQEDKDNDKIGDACDNCPSVSNADQKDDNYNGLGDVCEVKDSDGDSIPDTVDNCIKVPNSEQKDTDGDKMGDDCDSDADNDGVGNSIDNCLFVQNPLQEDADGNHRGDACETDYDKDGTYDRVDNCPQNKFINFTSFAKNTKIDFNPDLTSEPAPDWTVLHDGMEIRQELTTHKPVGLIGDQALDHMDFYGTTFAEDDRCTGHIGFIFGFESTSKFYVVLWKHKHYNQGIYGGVKGPQIRLFETKSKPGASLGSALYQSSNVANISRVIWHDPELRGWECKTSYRWHLMHRPSIGYMRLIIKHDNNVTVDSGPVYDPSILGGRLGVITVDQIGSIWSKLKYECKNRMNYALLLDGTDDYAEVGTLQELGIEKSFTLEALIKLPAGFIDDKYPILCTNASTLCMYVEDKFLKGQVRSTIAKGVTPLQAGKWTHVAMRYNAQERKLSLMMDGTTGGLEAHLNGVEPDLIWNGNETVYLGYDGTKFFKGELDEVRIYNIQVISAELDENMKKVFLHRRTNRYLLGAHYNMETTTNSSTVLMDNGYLSRNAVLQGKPSIIPSFSDWKRYDLTYN